MRFLLAALMALLASPLPAAQWPGWRNDGHGISPDKNVPTRWSKTDNIRWRTPLSERGNSSPIVWENKVFVTQPDGDRRTLICFDRHSGKRLWQAGPTYREKDPTHQANPFCSATPVTDGMRVVAAFGSAGIHAFDLGGKQLWQRDLGKQTHEWGYGSSPILHGDLCILYFGPGPRSFLTALDKTTGRTVWQVDVPEAQPDERFDGFAGKKNGYIGSWSTPIVVHAPGGDELVMTFANDMRGFVPKTGAPLWRTDGLNPLIYTSPIAGDGMIVGMGGFFGATVAVKQGGRGDLSGRKVWSVQREKRHRMSTGVIKDGHVYVCNTVGVAECLDLKTGQQRWEERLSATGANGEVWGSMVLAGDNLYVTNQSGDTFVIRATPGKFELLATNPLGELSNATPALSDGDIFIRTHQALWCVSNKAAPERVAVRPD